MVFRSGLRAQSAVECLATCLKKLFIQAVTDVEAARINDIFVILKRGRLFLSFK